MLELSGYAGEVQCNLENNVETEVSFQPTQKALDGILAKVSTLL